MSPAVDTLFLAVALQGFLILGLYRKVKALGRRNEPVTLTECETYRFAEGIGRESSADRERVKHLEDSLALLSRRIGDDLGPKVDDIGDALRAAGNRLTFFRLKYAQPSFPPDAPAPIDDRHHDDDGPNQ